MKGAYESAQISKAISTIAEMVNHPDASHRHNSPELEPANKLPAAERVYELNPDDIEPWQYADRIAVTDYSVDSLAKNIKLNGQQSPILVRKKIISMKLSMAIVVGELVGWLV